MRISDWSSDVCSSDLAQAQPGGKEAVAAMFCDKPGDALVVGLRGCGAESQSDFGQAQLEQAISPAALAVIIPLGRGPREDFDLAIIDRKSTRLNSSH